MSTYYLRRKSDGEIDNACETSGPPPPCHTPDTHYYAAERDVPPAVLKRYRYWDERP